MRLWDWQASVRKAAPAAVLGLLSATSCAAPLDPDKTLSQYVYENWDLEDGLPQNSVMSLAQDAQGYLWVGTYEGIRIFDGVDFAPLELDPTTPDFRNVITLHRAPDGSMWIGTLDWGVFRAVGRQVTRWTTDDGLLSDSVYSLLAEADGSVWIGTASGLNRFRDGAIEATGIEGGSVQALHADAQNTLWAAVDGQGLFARTSDAIRSWGVDDGLPSNRMRSLAPDGQGGYWLGTYGSGLVHFDGRAFVTRGRDDGLLHDVVRRLHRSGDGSLWIGTYGGGLQRLRGARWDSLTPAEGLTNPFVQSFFQDRDDTVWFGTSGGLNRLRNGKFVNISTQEGLLGNFVRAIAQDHVGALWVGTDAGGLSRIDDSGIATFGPDQGLHSSSVRALWPSRRGGVWAASYGGGLQRFDSRLMENLTLADGTFPKTYTRAILEDAAGQLWIGTDSYGLLKLDDDHLRRVAAQQLSSTDIRALHLDQDGRLWVGTYRDGIAIIVNDQVVAHYTVEDGLTSDTIFTMTADPRGGLWLGTDRGLTYYSDGKFHAYGRSAGLFSGAVFRVLNTDDQLWLCTNSGIIRVDRALGEDQAPQLIEQRTYTRADGMRSGQCNGASAPAGWKTADGMLWFPTADGISRLDPATTVDSAPPPALVRAVMIDGEKIPEFASLRMPANARRLQIDFGSLALSGSTSTRFRYRIPGIDASWVESGTQRQASYTNLAAGKYRFEVIAASPDGIWSSTPATVEIEKAPQLWERSSVRVAGLLALALIWFGGYRLRARRLRRVARELEEKVRLRTQALQKSNAELRSALRELNQAQDELVETRKQAGLGTLVMGMAHEINTPLGNAITVNSHLNSTAGRIVTALGDPKSAYSTQALGEKLIEASNILNRSLEAISTLVRRFKRLDASEGRTSLRELDLKQWIESRFDDWKAHASPHHIVANCAEPVVIQGNISLLDEIVAQLIQNSLDHAFGGDAGEIQMTIEPCDEGARWTYKDDGTGVPADLQASLFDPFTTTRRGTEHPGLGLHIVHTLATRALGGHVRLLGNEPGFSIEIILPRAR